MRPGGSQFPPYKRDARRRTAQRVENKTQAFDPAAGLDRQFEDRIERDGSMYEVPGARLRDLRNTEAERDRYRAALERIANHSLHAGRPEVDDFAHEVHALATEALKSDPRLVFPPVEGRSQDTTTPDGEGPSRGGT